VLGVELPIRAVFEHPTVAALATVLDEADAARPPLTKVAVRPERLPPSFAQQRLWFLEQFRGPGTAYNLPYAWRLEGGLDADALRAALGDVIGRHESLRTIFAAEDGQPYQRVIPAGEVTVPVTIATAAPGELPGLVEAAARHEFDLAGELPVRVSVFTVSPDEHVLVLVCHHIASDGWSMQVLMADLAAGPRAGRTCRSSTPITRFGSAICSATTRIPAASCPVRSATGPRPWLASPMSWCCRRTGPGPPALRTAVPR
jgi:hypothetical protein